MKLRKLEEALFKALMRFSMALVFACLFGILIVILWRGLPALSLSMLVQTPKGGYYLGGEGGIANAIVGSLYLAFGGLSIATAISLPLAFSLQREYTNPRVAGYIRFVLDILWGIPSIVYGAFGFIVMQHFQIRASLLGGILVLALLMIPILTRAADEVIRMVPLELKELSYAMGATRFETTLAIVLRQSLPGIITAIIIAFGRGIGDAASILFTAGYTDNIPRSLLDPVASLPLAVFFQINTPFPEVQERAYAAAMVLFFIVLITSLIARLLSRRLSRYLIR